MSARPPTVRRSRLFKEFVAVSWSAEPEVEGEGHIEVGYFGPDDLSPTLAPNPFGGPWTRGAVAGWLLGLALSERPVLIGIDAPFALPYLDEKAYFPGLESDPDSVFHLWQMIAKPCADDPSLLGDAFLEKTPLSAYFGSQDKMGENFAPRLRVCESALSEDIRPPSVFILDGKGTRARRALSVVRLVRLIKGAAGRALAVWPFDRPKPGQPTLVEINPLVFWRATGLTVAEIGDVNALNRALRSFRIQPVSVPPDELTPQRCDVLLSVAGIKSFFAQTEAWMPRRMNDMVARTEGWIFGLT